MHYIIVPCTLVIVSYKQTHIHTQVTAYVPIRIGRSRSGESKSTIMDVHKVHNLSTFYLPL